MIVYHNASRFARLHLGSTGQRAAYLALLGDQAHAWSAKDIGRVMNTDEAAVELALIGFVSAGLAETVGTDPVRYHWNAPMDTLFDDEDARRIDPICGMSVSADSPYAVAGADGALTWFCSHTCQAVYVGPSDLS